MYMVGWIFVVRIYDALSRIYRTIRPSEIFQVLTHSDHPEDIVRRLNLLLPLVLHLHFTPTACNLSHSLSPLHPRLLEVGRAGAVMITVTAIITGLPLLNEPQQTPSDVKYWYVAASGALIS